MQRTASARRWLLCTGFVALIAGCSSKSDTGTATGSATGTPAPTATGGTPSAETAAQGGAPATPASTGSDVDWEAYRRQTEVAPRDTLAPDAYRGWKQYELNCARCHGEFGVGTSFAPSLIVSLKSTVPDYPTFLGVVCGGRKEKGMPAWCELGLEQDKIGDIYSYLKLRADGTVAAGRPAQREG